MASKSIDEIEAIVGTYNLEELIVACEFNSEMDAIGKDGEAH